MSFEQNLQNHAQQGAQDAAASLGYSPSDQEQRAASKREHIPTRSLKQRFKRFVIVVLYSLQRALIPAVLIAASVFACLTYWRVEATDAKITLAFKKAEYAMHLDQPGSVFSLVDKKGRLHRIAAQRLIQLPHVADLSKQTEATLIHNTLIALSLGGIWLGFATLRSTRRLL